MVSRNEVSAALNRIRAIVLKRAQVSSTLDNKGTKARRERLLQERELNLKDNPGLPSPNYPLPTTKQHRNIRLGLRRIARVAPLEQSWKGIHVAGTNGKGSICAFLAGLFKLAGFSYGTFTSPAFPERHNAVLINGLSVNKRMFESELADVEARSSSLLARRYHFHSTSVAGINPYDLGQITPFEADTAAAFRVFNKLRVQYGIVEVGMGGATDATNIMDQKSVTIISKIDLDHQEYLGDTIKKIAQVKAGIMRANVPCVVDYSNTPEVLQEIKRVGKNVKAPVTMSSNGLAVLDEVDTTRFKLETYQRQNLLCALVAFQTLFPELPIDVNKLLAMDPFMPGRLEKVGVERLSRGQRLEPVLVDGAHNMLGVEALAKHVDQNVRKESQPVTWVVGISAGPSKPFAAILEKLLRPQDNIAFIEFNQGPTDPPPAPAQIGREIAATIVERKKSVYEGKPDIREAMKWACTVADGGPLVVTGSLYLIREFFALEGLTRTRVAKSRSPGRSQLYQFVNMKREGQLGPEEHQEFKRARRHWYLAPMGKNKLLYQRATGDKNWPPKISPEVAELQQKADFHEQQAEAYERALRGIEKDLERGMIEPSAATGRVAALEKYAEDFRAQVSTHVKAFDKLAVELEKNSILRRRKRLLPGRVPGRRRRGTRTADNPFMAYKLANAPTEAPPPLKTSGQKPIAAPPPAAVGAPTEEAPEHATRAVPGEAPEDEPATLPEVVPTSENDAVGPDTKVRKGSRFAKTGKPFEEGRSS